MPIVKDRRCELSDALGQPLLARVLTTKTPVKPAVCEKNPHTMGVDVARVAGWHNFILDLGTTINRRCKKEGK
jgi:hypothetical protein